MLAQSKQPKMKVFFDEEKKNYFGKKSEHADAEALSLSG
jgi:hypothetical protein